MEEKVSKALEKTSWEGTVMVMSLFFSSSITKRFKPRSAAVSDHEEDGSHFLVESPSVMRGKLPSQPLTVDSWNFRKAEQLLTAQVT